MALVIRIYLIGLVAACNIIAQISTPAIGEQLTNTQVSQFAGLALRGIFQEFPNKPSNVMTSRKGVLSPKEMHPVFYGCFDWHSSLHGHWMLIRLLRQYPDAAVAKEIEAKIDVQFTLEKLRKEADYFQQKGNASFERMYGWAWTLRMATELCSWDDVRAKRWAACFEPLEHEIVSLTKAYLPKLSWPIRTGVHPDTAFSLSQCLDYARAVDDEDFEQLIVARAHDFYVQDSDYPVRYEPSGEDFFRLG